MYKMMYIFRACFWAYLRGDATTKDLPRSGQAPLTISIDPCKYSFLLPPPPAFVTPTSRGAFFLLQRPGRRRRRGIKYGRRRKQGEGGKGPLEPHGSPSRICSSLFRMQRSWEGRGKLPVKVKNGEQIEN